MQNKGGKGLNQKFRKLKLLAYDFDGVMTDNKVYIDSDGKERVLVNRGDGYAVAQIKKKKICQAIFSTEENRVVSKRAEKLGIEAIQGLNNKKEALEAYCREKRIPLECVMFLGNDLNDYEVMKIVGCRGCPADAEEEIREICDWIASNNGGDGVIRELYRDFMNSIME